MESVESIENTGVRQRGKRTTVATLPRMVLGRAYDPRARGKKAPTPEQWLVASFEDLSAPPEETARVSEAVQTIAVNHQREAEEYDRMDVAATRAAYVTLLRAAVADIERTGDDSVPTLAREVVRYLDEVEMG